MKKILVCLLVTFTGWAQSGAPTFNEFNEFRQIVNVEDQDKFFIKLLKENPEIDLTTGSYDDFLANLAVAWLYKGNIEKYKHYTKSNPNFSAINLVELVYALEKLENEGTYASIIEGVSRDMIEKLERKEKQDIIERGRLQVLLELNAMANAQLGHVDIALKQIEKSSKIDADDRNTKYFKNSKSSYYDRYAIVLSAAGKNQQALDTLIKAVRNADSKPKLVNTFKDVYKKVHDSDKGLEKMISALKDEAYKNIYKKVEKDYIVEAKLPFEGKIPDPSGSGDKLTVFTANRPVYDVSLPNTAGKMVNLSDYKDHILVVDFWTTGCTPCVAAFSGFEKVVDDYANDPFQLFVINLFESQKTVQSFVAKKGITLDVLQDEPNQAFNVMATPTKIIFDGNGHIRFHATGYAGSTDGEYYKLKAMVEIVKSKI